MKNKGFTYLEMVCVLTVITILVVITILIIQPKVLFAKRSTFIDNANSISKAAITKFTNDGMDDENGYPDDLYIHDKNNDEHFGTVCYSLKTLKKKYIKKIDDTYQGSVEVCTSNHCGFKTRIWLSNDEYYINGTSDNVSRKDLSSNVFGINRCGE